MPKRQAPSPWAPAAQRGQQRQIKRDAVLATAAQLFNERGFHATSLDDIAARLNVSKPTLYYYVKNKDEILIECVRNGLQMMNVNSNVQYLIKGLVLILAVNFLAVGPMLVGIPALAKDRLGAQVSTIEKYHTPYVIVIGKKEAVEKSAIVRRTDTYSQDTVPLDQLPDYMKKVEKEYWGK